MSRKYIDELNIDTRYLHDDAYYEEEGDNERIKKWKRERDIYGFDSRETWDLDFTMVLNLYERLKMYNEVNIVDTNSHFNQFEYQGKTLTVQDAIDWMLEAAEEYLTMENSKYFNCLHEESEHVEPLYLYLNSETKDDDGNYIVRLPEETKESHWYHKRFRAIENDAFACKNEFWEIWSLVHNHIWW